jgi:hypothetical protein
MSITRVLLAVGFSLLTLLAVGGTAAAQAPPGDSEFDQYVPDLPQADKDDPIRDVREDAGDVSEDADAGSGDGTLSPEIVEELRAQGSEGESAAALAEATAPENVGRAETGDAEEVGGTSSAGAVVDALSGDADVGMGAVLPLALTLVAAAGIGYGVLKWRRTAANRSAGPRGG